MKKIAVICLLVFTLVFCLYGCAKNDIELEEEKDEKPVYNISASLEKDVLKCKVELTTQIKAKTGDIYFYSPVDEYENITLNGEKVESQVKDGVLTLKAPLEKGEAKFYFEYALPIKEKGDRFGKANGVYYANSFYPVVIYSNDDETRPYSAEKPTVSRKVFDFTAELHLPKNLFTLSSGEIVADEKGEKERVVKIRGENVRDFTFTSSSAFINRNQGKIHYYFVSDRVAQTNLSTADECVKIYDESFGEIFTELYVVKADYPFSYASTNLVLIKNSADQNVLTKELARYISGEWWGITISSNAKAPYLQDSLRGFSTLIYYLKSGNGKEFNALKEDLKKTLETRTIAGKDTAIGKSTYDYGEDYEECVYKLGAWAFFELYSLYGVNVFDGLKRFAKENADGIVTTDDLFSAFDNKSEYTSFLSAWITGNVVHALSAHTAIERSVKPV